MATKQGARRQLVDWRAAFWAGVFAGAAFLILNLILVPWLIGGNGWVIIRLFASVVMGEEILAPPSTFDGAALAAGIATHFVLSIGFTLFIAFVVHKGGMLGGIVIGAALGLAFYCVNFYTMTLIFPWFFAMANWVFVLTHCIFGAVAGGVYELLEVERFAPAAETEA